MTEVTTECWSCDADYVVEVEAGEASIRDSDEGCCPHCGQEQDLDIEYDVSDVYANRPKHVKEPSKPQGDDRC